MKGIMFDDVHSFYDLNLVLSAVNIPPATVKTNFVNNPGGDGSWDLTEAHGKVLYNDRNCTFTLSVLPEDDFEEKKTEVSNLLNGRRCKIALDKDPGYYWIGRVSVNSYETSKKLRKIVLGAVVAPYKLKSNKTVVFLPCCGKNLVSNNPDSWESIYDISISNNVMTSLNSNGASNFAYMTAILPKGSFVCSGTFQGNVRFLAQLFDSDGNMLTDQDISFGAFNSYYKGFFFGASPQVLRIPDRVAYWRFGVVFTSSDASLQNKNVTISNLQLEMGQTATEFEPFTPNADPQQITLINARKTVCPSIIVADEATVTFSGGEVHLGEGTHKVLDLQLHEGETPVTVSGTGSVTFVYQEGDL